MAIPQMEFSLSPASLNITTNVQVIEHSSTGGFTGVVLPPAAAAPGPSNNLIQRDQDFDIKFDWTENGLFANFLGGGKWQIDVLFERMGGAETAFNPSTNQVSAGVPGQSYTATVNIPKNTLDAGLYRVVTRMQWHFASGNPGPLVMFSDIGLIQIYQDS